MKNLLLLTVLMAAVSACAGLPKQAQLEHSQISESSPVELTDTQLASLHASGASPKMIQRMKQEAIYGPNVVPMFLF